MHNLKHSQFQGLVLLVLSVSLFGCPLTNKNDAQNSSDLSSSVSTNSVLPKNTNRVFSNTMARVSGNAFAAQFIALFPGKNSWQSSIGGAGTDAQDPDTYHVMELIMSNTGATPTYPMGVDSKGSDETHAFFTVLGSNLRDSSNSVDPIVQGGVKQFFADWVCTASRMSGTSGSTQNSGTILFTEGNDILLAGESFPAKSDANLRLAFTAARRGFFYPYPADSPVVLALKRAIDASSSAAAAKRNLCIGVMMAPQFWFGTGMKDDFIRRAAFELTGKPPLFSDYDRFRSGQLTPAQYVTELQQKPEYINTILRWHGEQLGFRPIGNSALMEDYATMESSPTRIIGVKVHIEPGSNFGTSAPAELQSAKVMIANANWFASNDTTSFHWDSCPVLSTELSYLPGKYPDWSQTVWAKSGDLPKVQPFDPRTTGIIWQQWNPHTSKFETLAGWVLKGFEAQYAATLGITAQALASGNYCSAPDPVKPGNGLDFGYGADSHWMKCAGEITLNDNSKLRINLSDITYPVGANTGTVDFGHRRYYPPNSSVQSITATKLAGTPMETAPDMNWRKILRMSPTGPQNGFSKIKGAVSGQDFYACNGLLRMVSSCSYRPGKNDPVVGRTWAYRGSVWNAEVSAPFTGFSNDGFPLSGWAAPQVLQNMHCGIPNNDEMKKPLSSYRDDLAFPYGHEMYGDVDVNGQFSLPASWTSGTAVNQANYTNVAWSVFFAYGQMGLYSQQMDGPEATAYRVMADGFAKEPYRLIEDIVKNGKSYKLLTTANYSFMSRAQELFFRKQGRMMMSYPEGYTMPTSMDDLNTVSQINEFDVKPIPAKATIPNSIIRDSHFTDAVDAASTVKPKIMSGIMTMPAFLQPMMGGSVRSVSARVFKRLLCGEPNVYTPSGAAADLHMSYFKKMPDSTWATTDHDKVQVFVSTHLSAGGGLRNDCMTCHINLDPLGMALFKYYGSLSVNKFGLDKVFNDSSEFQVHDLSQGYLARNSEIATPWNGYFGNAGDRDSTGEGAILGKKVVGWKEVGQVISESREFAACAVNTAFTNYFGRAPNANEATVYLDPITARFMTSYHYDYNRMIQDVVSIQPTIGDN